MAGAVSFQVEVFQPNADILPEMAGRAKDLSPVFQNIITEWARDNEDKFGLSMGQESGGAQIDPTVFWMMLAESTMKMKRKRGQADQIMVATGSLEASLTDPAKFFQMVNPTVAQFGTPLDADDAMKIQYNWLKRQTVFLSLDDQRMIEKEMSDYMALGGDYRQRMFNQGLSNLALKKEVAQMDIDFANDADQAEFGGDWPVME